MILKKILKKKKAETATENKIEKKTTIKAKPVSSKNKNDLTLSAKKKSTTKKK